MTGLMVGGDLFFLRDDTALLLCADADLDKRTVNIRLANVAAVLLCCENCGLVHQVFQICSVEAGGGFSHAGQIYILT